MATIFNRIWVRYWQIARGSTIGITAINFGSSLYNDEKTFQHPTPYFGASMLKGFYLGILWPVIPLKLFKDPRDIYLLGNSLSKLEFDDDIKIEKIGDINFNKLENLTDNMDIKLEKWSDNLEKKAEKLEAQFENWVDDFGKEK